MHLYTETGFSAAVFKRWSEVRCCLGNFRKCQNFVYDVFLSLVWEGEKGIADLQEIGWENFEYTFMRRLTTGILSEKCVVRRFCRCANVIECTYTNLDSIA